MGAMKYAFVCFGPCVIWSSQLLAEHLTINIFTPHMLSLVDSPNLIVHSPHIMWKKLQHCMLILSCGVGIYHYKPLSESSTAPNKGRPAAQTNKAKLKVHKKFISLSYSSLGRCSQFHTSFSIIPQNQLHVALKE